MIPRPPSSTFADLVRPCGRRDEDVRAPYVHRRGIQHRRVMMLLMMIIVLDHAVTEDRTFRRGDPQVPR